MDVGKYLDLITRAQLWFTRAVELRKNDPYEGALTERDEINRKLVTNCRVRNELKDVFISIGYHNYAELMDGSMSTMSMEWFQALFFALIALSVDMVQVQQLP